MESFFNILLGFFPTWDYKCDQIYFSEKIKNTNPIDKYHLEWNCINGSILNVAREPILHSFNLIKFILNQKQYIKIYRKIIKHVFSNITFYLEGDDKNKVDINSETMTFI